MNETKKTTILQLPLWEDLPALELYMDQVLSYINEVLRPLQPELPELSKSMVNNYVKNSIVKPPIKKHYKRYHIAFLLIVCLLKPCFTLSEISGMIAVYLKMDSSNMAHDYNHFVRYYQNCLDILQQTGTSVPFETEGKTPEQALMYSVIQTAVFHYHSQQLLKSQTG